MNIFLRINARFWAVGTFFLIMGISAFAQTPAPPVALQRYRLSLDTCPLYEYINKKWVKLDSNLFPVGSEIAGVMPKKRKDIIYTSWQGRVFSISVRCLTELNSPAVSAAHTKDDNEVDLGDPSAVGSAMDASMVASAPNQERRDTPPPEGTPKVKSNFGPPQGVAPTFHVLFDFDLVDRPNIEPLSFDNYHSFLFFEILPTPDISFSFDVESSPKYYELDYQLTPRLQFRAGKIWIPFDDLSPHNIYGGRVNVSRIAPGPPFLPDIWTEMGIGFKYQFVDTKNFNLVGDLYIVNGFGSGGTDPLGNSPDYPNFADTNISVSDNNSEKAIGGRLHALFNNKFGLGVSLYNGRWSDSSQPSESVTMYGSDFRYQFGKSWEARAGFIVMDVGLRTGDFVRGGYYTELGKRFGKQNMWKVLVREGQVQEDNRVIAKSDQEIVGMTLLCQPNALEYSIEYSQDIEKNALKSNYNYFAARIVMAF